MMKVKMILAAAAAAALVGGYQGFAESFILSDITMTGTQLKDDAYTGIGDHAALTITTPGQSSNGVILRQQNEQLAFSNLKSFTINNTSDLQSSYSDSGVIVASSGGTITFDNVKNINLGSADNVLNNKNPVIHGFSGSVSISGADNLNIYADGDGITGQQSNGNSTTAGYVNISAQNITMQIGGIGVSSAVYADKNHVSKDTTSVMLDAADSISITSTDTYGTAAQIADNYGNTIGEGNATLTIHAGNNIDLKGNYVGVWISRASTDSQGNVGDSDLQIHSDNGDVTITGDAYGIVSTAADETATPITGTISGENVTVDGATGIFLNRSAGGNGEGLNLNGDSVKVSGGSGESDAGIRISNNSNLNLQGNVIDVSGTTAVDAQSGSKLNLQGTGSNSVINLTSTIDNGAAVAAKNGGQITLGDDKTATDVNINGYVVVSGAGSQLTFADKTTTHVDSKYLTGTASFITVDDSAGDTAVAFDAGAKLDIGDIKTGTALNFSKNKTLNEAAAEAIKTNNVLQQVTVDKVTGNMTVGTVDNKEAAALLGGSALTNVALYATQNNNDSITNLITSHADDTAAVEEALNSAAGLAAMSNTAHGTYTMNGIFSDAVSGHLMNRQDQDVWAYGFHSKENVNGLSFGADYDAQYNGIAAGVDFYRKGGTTAGLALIYADSNVSGANGVSSTKNDADYYGVSLYSRFDRGSYALLGDISYMKGDHDITQVNSGETITASPDSDSISVGVKAVKDYAAGENGTLTPYVGLRYLRLSTDDFTASNGLRYEGDDQDLVIVPVGVNYTAAISHGKWSVRPYAGIGYVWTAGDRSADQTVMLGTAADSFSYDTADSGSFIARAGVTTDCGDMSYGIGYSWQKGDSVSNNGWTLSASYHF